MSYHLTKIQHKNIIVVFPWRAIYKYRGAVGVLVGEAVGEAVGISVGDAIGDVVGTSGAAIG